MKMARGEWVASASCATRPSRWRVNMAICVWSSSSTTVSCRCDISLGYNWLCLFKLVDAVNFVWWHFGYCTNLYHIYLYNHPEWPFTYYQQAFDWKNAWICPQLELNCIQVWEEKSLREHLRWIETKDWNLSFWGLNMERENIASKLIYPEVRFFRRTHDSSFIKSITVDITVIFLSDEFSSFLRITRWYVSQGDPYAMVILHRAEARRFRCVSLCMADVSRFGIFWLCNNSDGQWFRYRWCLMIHQRYLNNFPYIFTNHVWWFLMETLWFFIATLNIQRVFEYANIIKRIKPPLQSFPRSRIIYMKPHRKIHESYSTVYQNEEPLESHGTWRTYEITNL